MAVIHDLIGATQNSTNSQSAQLSHPQVKSKPADAFTQMLLKYATPVANTINSTVQNTANDLVNTFKAPFVDIGTYAKIQSDPVARAKLDAINNNKNLTLDQKENMGNALMQQYGGQTPEQSASAERGAQFGSQLIVPAANGNIPVHSPLPSGTVEGIGRQGAEVASDAKKATQEVVNTAKSQPGGLQAGFVNLGGKAEAEAKAAKVPMITKAKADPQAIAKYNLIFDVPRQKAQNMMVHPETVVNQLIDDGVVNVKSLDQLQDVANSVTGEGGAFAQINNHILGKIENPLDYSEVLKFKNNELPRVLEGERPSLVNEVENNVKAAMEPLNYNKPGELPSPLPGHLGYAQDLFQTSQNLQRLVRMYQRKAYTAMGDLAHPELERIADKLQEMKNNIDDVIDLNIPPKDYEALKKDPFVQQQLQRVPPKVAQRWLAGATRFKDGQTIQAPYVNLSHMIEDTKDTQLSVWTKAAKAMQGQSTSGRVADTITSNLNPKTAVQNVVGGTIKKVLSPLDKTPEQIFAENTSGQSASLRPSAGSGVKKIIAGGVVTGGVAAGANMLQKQSNANSNDSTYNPNKSHNGQTITGHNINVKDLPQTDKITADTPLPHPSSIEGANGSLAISDDQYNNTISQLEALKQDPSYQVFPKSEQLNAAIQAVTNKHNQSKPLLDKYEQVTQLDQQIQQAYQLLDKTSPHMLNALPFLGGASQALQENTDPAYKQLMNVFSSIENQYPGLKGSLTSSSLVSKKAIQASLEQAKKMIISDYLNTVRNYAGDQTSSQTTQTSSQFQAPQTSNLAPLNGGSIDGGGTVGGDPSTPLAAF